MAGLLDVPNELENRRKVQPQPSGLQRGINNAVGGAVNKVTSFADNYLGGKGTRQLLSAAGSGLTNMMNDRVGGQRKKTKEKYLAKKGLAADTQSLAQASGMQPGEAPRITGDMRTDGIEEVHNVNPNTQYGQAGVETGAIQTDAPVQEGNRNGTGPIMLTNVGGGNEGGRALGDVDKFKAGVQANEKKRWALGGNYPQQADGSYQVGNMDVAFDPDTDPAAAKRFLEDPVHGGERHVSGGIENFKGRTERSAPGIKEPELISYETNPNMDWRQAAALNEAKVKGYESKELAAIDNEAGFNLADINNAAAMDKQAAGGALREEQDNRGMISDAYRFGAPMSDAANKVYNAKAGSKVNLKGLNSVPRPKAKTADQSHWVPVKLDKKGKQIPGTGQFVLKPEASVPDLGDNFDPMNPTPQQTAAIEGVMSQFTVDSPEWLLMKKKYGMR